jgi:hypothetical protein
MIPMNTSTSSSTRMTAHEARRRRRGAEQARHGRQIDLVGNVEQVQRGDRPGANEHAP